VQGVAAAQNAVDPMQQNVASLRPVSGTPALPHGLRALTIAASRLRAAHQAEATIANLPDDNADERKPLDAEPMGPGDVTVTATPPSPIRSEHLRLVVLLSGAHAFLSRRAASGERLTEDERVLVGTIGAELDRARQGLLAFALEEAVALIERPSCAGRIRRTADQEPADLESLVLTMVRQTARLAQGTLAARGVAAADLAESRMRQADSPSPTLAALVADLRAKFG
jgi:hypothetical protein